MILKTMPRFLTLAIVVFCLVGTGMQPAQATTPAEVAAELIKLQTNLGSLQGNLGLLKDGLTELTTKITRLTTPSNFDSSQYDKMLKIGLPVEAVRKKMEADGVAEPDIKKLCGPKPASTAPPYKRVKPILDPDKTASEPGKTSSELSFAEELLQTVKNKKSTPEPERLLFSEEPLANETLADYLTRYVTTDKDPQTLRDRISAILHILNNDYEPSNNDDYNELATSLVPDKTTGAKTDEINTILARRDKLASNNDAEEQTSLLKKPITITPEQKEQTLKMFNDRVKAIENENLEKLAQQETAARALLTKTSDYLALEENDKPSSTNDTELAVKLRKWYDKQIAYMTNERTASINARIAMTEEDLATKTANLQPLDTRLTSYFPSNEQLELFRTQATKLSAIKTKPSAARDNTSTENVDSTMVEFLKNILEKSPNGAAFKQSHLNFCTELNKKPLPTSLRRNDLASFYTELIQPTLIDITKKQMLDATILELKENIKTATDGKNRILETIQSDAKNNLAWLLADLFKEKATSKFREATIETILSTPSDDETVSRAIDEALAKISDFFDKTKLEELAKTKKRMPFNLLVQQYKKLLLKFNKKNELLDEKFSNSLGKLVALKDCAILVQAIKENNKDSTQPINKNSLPEWLFTVPISPATPLEGEDINVLLSRIKDADNYDNIATFWAILYNYKTINESPFLPKTIKITIPPSAEDLEWDEWAQPTIETKKIGINNDDLVEIKTELTSNKGFNTSFLKKDTPKDLFLKTKVNDLINLTDFDNIFDSYKKMPTNSKSLEEKTPILVDLLEKAQPLKTQSEQKEPAATNIQ